MLTAGRDSRGETRGVTKSILAVAPRQIPAEVWAEDCHYGERGDVRSGHFSVPSDQRAQKVDLALPRTVEAGLRFAGLRFVLCVCMWVDQLQKIYLPLDAR